MECQGLRFSTLTNLPFSKDVIYQTASLAIKLLSYMAGSNSSTFIL